MTKPNLLQKAKYYVIADSYLVYIHDIVPCYLNRPEYDLEIISVNTGKTEPIQLGRRTVDSVTIDSTLVSLGYAELEEKQIPVWEILFSATENQIVSESDEAVASLTTISGSDDEY